MLYIGLDLNPIIKKFVRVFTTVFLRLSSEIQKKFPLGGLTRNSLFSLSNSYELLAFLPTDYETWLYKLFMELGLNPIIEIFRSGFYDFVLAVDL